MAINLPKYGLVCLYKFPVYRSRREYRMITGKECPEFDPTRNPKYWEDPGAQANVKFQASYKETVDGTVKQDLQEESEWVVYKNVLAVDKLSGKPLAGADGKPYFGPLYARLETAQRVNIPEEGRELAAELTTPVPVPCRELEDCERLDWGDHVGEWVVVRNSQQEAVCEQVAKQKAQERVQSDQDVNYIEVEPEPSVAYTMADKKLLKAIATKLGIE